MAFPFSSWFKGKQAPAEAEPAPEQAPAPAPRANPAQAASAANMRNSQPISAVSMRAGNPVSGPRQTQPVKQAAIRSVVPNSGQPPINLRESPAPPRPVAPGIRPAGGGPAMAPAKVSPVMPTARTISFGGGGSPSPSIPSFPSPRPEAEPAAPAPSGPDFVVELTVGDFVDRVPPGLLNAGPYPREEAVRFLSSEFYSDLSKGRASVPASVIYGKCPAIFARPISETEDAEVPLPLQKIVGQMSAALQTRPDQFHEETGAEIETPFLQVAKEDNARLPKATGTTVGVLPGSEPPPADGLPASVSRSGMRRSGQISPIPSIKPMAENMPTLAPPTAASAGAINPGKRPPSTVRASVAGGKIRLSGPAAPVRNIVPTAQQPAANPPPAPGQEPARPSAGSPSHQVAKKTARIQIPPISLRPPGAAGPRPPSAFNPPAPAAAPAIPSLRSSPPQETKMPNFRPAPPTPISTRRIPATFGATAQPPLPPPAFPATPPAGAPLPSVPPAPAMLVPAPAPVSDRKISLGLAAILRGVPSSSLAVNPSAIADNERITLPFGPIESQLSLGRVTVPRGVFVEALPEARRQIFAGDDTLEEIPIPLQEVFQNLPANALAIRSDQMVEETTHIYATPFSQKAAEDAERLGFVEAVKPVASVPEEVAAAPTVEGEAPAATPVDLVEVDEERSPMATFFEAPLPAAVDEPPAVDSHGAPISIEPAERESAASFDSLPPLESAFGSHADHTEAAPESLVESPVPKAALASDFLHDEAPAADFADVKLPLLEPISAAPLHLELPAPPTELLLLDEQPQTNSLPRDSPAEHPADLPETFNTVEPFSETPSDRHPEDPGFVSVLPATVDYGASVDAPAFDPDEASAFTVPSEPSSSEETVHTPTHAAAPVTDSPLQTLFMSEEDMDAKTIVRHICQLPGIDACAIMFADGLPLAGNFPENYEKAGFSAMAPSFFSRALTFTEEVRLGRLEAYTLYLDNGLLSFFMCGGIGLSVRHTGRGFFPGVREKLGVVTRELAAIYSSEKPSAPIPVA